MGGKRPAVAHGGRGVGSGAEAQPELRGRCSIVRELHVYGTAVAVHSRDSDQHQHQVRNPPGNLPEFYSLDVTEEVTRGNMCDTFILYSALQSVLFGAC